MWPESFRCVECIQYFTAFAKHTSKDDFKYTSKSFFKEDYLPKFSAPQNPFSATAKLIDLLQ
jgi:hypothetical protein